MSKEQDETRIRNWIIFRLKGITCTSGELAVALATDEKVSLKTFRKYSKSVVKLDEDISKLIKELSK